MEIIFKLNSVSEIYELREWLNSLNIKKAPNNNLIGDIGSLNLTVRTANCLKARNILTISDLVTWSKEHLLKTPNFVHKSIKEIEDVLMLLDLELSSTQKATCKTTPNS